MCVCAVSLCSLSWSVGSNRETSLVMWLWVKDAHLMVWKCTREMFNNVVCLTLTCVCNSALTTAHLL